MTELFYQNSIEEYSAKRNKTAVRRNLLTITKLLLFALFTWFLYTVIDSYSLWKILTLVAIAICFTILTKIDAKVFRQLKLYESIIECCNIEIDYLAGNFSKLDKGDRYISPVHPYSHDLDIFGEESMFCALNRSITGRGSDRIASLLTQEMPDSSAIIQERQRAISELKEKNGWSLLFRATGINNPVLESDMEYIGKWRREPLFFAGKTWRYLLYASNTIMLLLIVAAILDPFFITIAGS